jgi:predicted O-methyltransferase YrrM
LVPAFVKRTPPYRWLRGVLQRRLNPLGTNQFLQYAPPGHFYSSIPDLEFVDRHRARLFDRAVSALPGIDTHDAEQLALLEQLAAFYPELPFTTDKSDGLRYYFENQFFRYADAIVLYSMLRQFRPRRVIEVGSGFSSSVMLDTNDKFLGRSVRFTFIEPEPSRLQDLINDDDKARNELIDAPVQDVPLDRFAALEANDILFIDSSHVAKVGSDVVHLLSYVLPALNHGVIVHFHDVFWPFEYPEEWIWEGRAWNEAYVLKAFLQFNSSFKILLFNSYVALRHPGAVARCLPLCATDGGASLWLTKCS